MAAPTRAALVSRFEESARLAAALQPHVDEILGLYASRSRYLYLSRLKSLESSLQKLETGRLRTVALDDVLACTLVVPTLPEVATCIAGLPKRVLRIRDKGPSTRTKEPSVFRFDDEQLVCRLASPTGTRSGGTLWDQPFELQVKTVSQYAWGEATHDLVYKGDRIDWRRERLSAQLRALAEQADLLYAEFLAVSDRILPSASSRTGEMALVARYLFAWRDRGLLRGAQLPPSVVRFAESTVDLCRQLGLRPEWACRPVTRHLRRNGAPVSISLFQLILGVIGSQTMRPVSWLGVPSDYCVPVTSELLDLFPALNRVPDDVRIQMT